MIIYRLERICNGRIYDVRYYEALTALKKGMVWHGLPVTNPKLIDMGYTHKVWKMTGEDITNE